MKDINNFTIAMGTEEASYCYCAIVYTDCSAKKKRRGEVSGDNEGVTLSVPVKVDAITEVEHLHMFSARILDLLLLSQIQHIPLFTYKDSYGL